MKKDVSFELGTITEADNDDDEGIGHDHVIKRDLSIGNDQCNVNELVIKTHKSWSYNCFFEQSVYRQLLVCTCPTVQTY